MLRAPTCFTITKDNSQGVMIVNNSCQKLSSTLVRLPLPQCFCLRGTKLRPWSEQNSDQNSDHPRLCMYWGKEKLRPWSEFLGRENSDHGLSLGCFWGRGRRGGSHISIENARRKKKKTSFRSGGVGVFHAKGWGSKSPFPHSKPREDRPLTAVIEIKFSNRV